MNLLNRRRKDVAVMSNNTTSSIITIGRKYGSAGRQIGQEVAKYFGIKCYDKEQVPSGGNVQRVAGLLRGARETDGEYVFGAAHQKLFASRLRRVAPVIALGFSIS